ncbi:biotin carboxyl carrier protein of acetyl-CoA carboxylase 1, chloroplastic-like isoform X3 [Tasmannia lanceolata]|uniref:biotin carboxyl carrier protein of acetyl-CoA carboxylase 1, chloroplastic-like isoform X3 n=1 Tax=Tasmannia lanceolata TaxID=3420 RepID=UPI0040634B1F
MASSLPTASASATVTKSSSSSSSQRHNHGLAKVSFHLSSKPNLLFSNKGSRTNWNRSVVTKAKLNESEVASASEETISEFMTQVASLVKFVDSRDIVELQLKQLDCELIIRKKEALPQAQAPVVMMHSPSPQVAMPSQYAPAQTVAAPTPAGPVPSLSPSPTPPPASKPAKSSLPPLKCPMAGTFYRSPGPGEPPFVKVGDQVKKGQVLCIIEAMKLMNEIEVEKKVMLEVLLVSASGLTCSHHWTEEFLVF